MSAKSLKSFISRKTLPWLLLILFAITLMFMLFTRYLVEQQLVQHHSAISLRFSENLQRNIQSLNQQVANVASNDLVINGLIDLQEREKYIPMFFRTLSLAGIPESKLLLTDFSGSEITSTGIEFGIDNWQELVLKQGQSISQLTADGLYIAAPVLYADYPEGAVLSHISLQQLYQGLNINLDNELLLYLHTDGTVLFSSSLDKIHIGSKFSGLDDADWYQYHRQYPGGEQIISAEPADDIFAQVGLFILIMLAAAVASLIATLVSIHITGRLASSVFDRFLRSIKGVRSSGSWQSLLPQNDEPKEVSLLRVEFNQLLGDLAKSSLSVSRFNNIINSLVEHLVVFDHQGKVLLKNNSFSEFLQQIHADPNNPLLTMLPSDLSLKHLVNNTDSTEFEAKYSLSGSKAMTIHWSQSPYLSESGEIEGFVLVGTDITQTQQMEQSIHLMSRVMDKADTSIVISDATQAHMPIVYLNQAFSKLTGYSEQQALGKNCRFLQGKETQSASVDKIRQAISQQQAVTETLLNYKKDGSPFYNELTLTPIHDNQGRLTHYLGIQLDASSRVRAENYLINAKNKAEESARLKSEFLASMSHEIRTPINGVMGMLSLLQQGKLSPEQSHYVDLAKFSADSLLGLINDILDFSKIEAGKMELEILEFDLRSQLGDFAESMALKAQSKGVELILDVTELNFTMVAGDPGRIRQILHNLVGNAIKFTEQGEVLIKVAIHEQLDGALQLFASIKDTGIGIGADKLGTLFDSFTQEDTSTTRKYGGTGLGLAIAKQLCELMDGQIKVESQLGLGSNFMFELTLAKSEKVSANMPEVSLQGKRILIVDDNLTNRQMLVKQLGLWQADVHQAKGASTAIKMIRSAEQPFDIALLDMRMHGMDGENLGRAIRADQSIQQPKLVMMTSIAERGDAQRFADAGFDAYFAKPVTTRDLFDALTVLVDGGEAMSAASPLVTRHHLRALNRPMETKSSRILLVEDNHINQIVALEMMKKLGYKADVAANGVEALAILNSTPADSAYELLIMDCQMPEMDGYDATRAIRQGKGQDMHANVVVIAMTANAMKGDREKCLQAGMNDYLAKPISENELQDKLSHWL